MHIDWLFIRRLHAPAFAAVVVLCLAAVPASGQNDIDFAELETIRPDLDSALSEVETGVRIHSGSLIGGLLLPLAWPIGTPIGSHMTLQGAQSYRDSVSDVFGESPLPDLRGARGWHIAGIVGYGTATVAFGTIAVLALTQWGNPTDLSLEINIAGTILAGGFVLGMGGTTYATWRARNTTLRFDRILGSTD